MVRKMDVKENFFRAVLPMAVAVGRRRRCCCCRARHGRLHGDRGDRDGHPVPRRRQRPHVRGLIATAGRRVRADDRASPWRRERIFAYLDPWDDNYALGKAYQLSHSLIAFGRGEIFGQGLGGSVEKLHYLPEAHTDFLLAVIGEELGFVGVLVVILLFFWLTRRSFDIGRQAIALDRVFAGLVAQGVGIWIGVPGLHQHGREPRRAADQGPDAAADELRRLGDRDEPGRAGDGAAHRLSRTGS